MTTQSSNVFFVDFNEMIGDSEVLFSQVDVKTNIEGESVPIHEGMRVKIIMDDIDDDGIADNLVAEGKVTKNTFSGWAKHVKWSCEIDSKGIRHESEI